MISEFNLTEKEKVLIIAPHPDDETFGCGGLMLRYPNQCDVLLVTDGRKGHVGDYCGREDELVKVRENEFLKIINMVGIHGFYKLDVPDGESSNYRDRINSFNFEEYDYVFFPNRYDENKDHAIWYRTLKRLKRKFHYKYIMMEYEVGTLLHYTPVYSFLTEDILNKKKCMIEEYKSQLEDINYLRSVIALNIFRGEYAGVDYAEAYCPSEYVTLFRRVYSNLPLRYKERIRGFLHRNENKSI